MLRQGYEVLVQIYECILLPSTSSTSAFPVRFFLFVNFIENIIRLCNVRFNPFDKKSPPPETYAILVQSSQPKSEDLMSPKSKSVTSSFDDEPDVDDLEPLEPFLPRWETTGGWNLLLRQPFRKHLTQNRFWKPAFVRVGRSEQVTSGDRTPVIKVFSDDKSSECLHELALDPSYSLCEMGLQQLDQFGKCHTVKLQQVSNFQGPFA